MPVAITGAGIGVVAVAGVLELRLAQGTIAVALDFQIGGP